MVSDDFRPYDVSDWEVNPVPVAGRYPKLELLRDNKKYILKLSASKQNGVEIPYHVSEYIACRVVKSLGYDIQEVAMVVYHNQPACLIELFDTALVTFEGFGTPTMSQANLIYDLDILHELFPEGKFKGNFSEYIWETFLCDAFIHNLDRHPNNWGFFRVNDMYEKAPLIDCASSLYSLNALELGKMKDAEVWISKFGNSAIHYKGERNSFRNILLSEKSEQFRVSAEKFKTALNSIDYSCLANISRHWKQYAPYIEFVREFLERQVDWFEKHL